MSCSKCCACQQKQGFGHLRSRSTIAIKSRFNFFEKNALCSLKSSNFDRSEIEQLWRNTIWPNFDQCLSNFDHILIELKSKFAQFCTKFGSELDPKWGSDFWSNFGSFSRPESTPNQPKIDQLINLTTHHSK